MLILFSRHRALAIVADISKVCTASILRAEVSNVSAFMLYIGLGPADPRLKGQGLVPGPPACPTGVSVGMLDRNLYIHEQ
jgi:hypothetical protein